MRARLRTTTLALIAGAALLALARRAARGRCLVPDERRQRPSKSPLAGNGMWIWYLSRSSHGKLGAIAKKAHAHGIDTVLIKSGDGTTYWNQFSPAVVNGLHARGLDVCAWQFIYGDKPGKEAKVGAAAVANGADCLVLDVEGQYEGKYPQASYFMSSLRSLVGPGLSDRARQLPVRRLPPGPPLLGLPRSRWGSVQHPAALLEGHRHHGRHRLHPHLGVEPDLRPADRSARAGVQPPEGGADQAVPRPGHVARLRRRQLVGLAGGGQAAVEGGRPARLARVARGRTRAIRSSIWAPRATSWPGPSSCSRAAATAFR